MVLVVVDIAVMCYVLGKHGGVEGARNMPTCRLLNVVVICG